MTFIPPSTFTLMVFMGIIGGVIGALLLGTFVAVLREEGLHASRRVTLRLAMGIVVWLLVLSFPIATGMLEAAPFPRLLLFMALSNVGAVLLAFSWIGKLLAKHLSLSSLVGFQAFRLPLELVLHAWSEGGTIPQTMTWNGENIDVFSGIAAASLAPFCQRIPSLAWGANIVGIVLLLNVGRVAVMSSPLPFAWGVEPPLQLAFNLPYALIVPVCVAGALAGHLILTMRLLKDSR